MTHPTIQQTIQHMLVFHYGQVDKSGVPYYNHPMRVMLRLGPLAPEAALHAALLHDVMEDCDVTREILLDLGYSEDVVQIVELVSKMDKSMQYRQFIFNIIASGNTGAMMVKLADLYDNTSLVRRELLPPDIRPRIEANIVKHYQPAIMFIRSCLGDEFANTIIKDEMEVIIDMKESAENEG